MVDPVISQFSLRRPLRTALVSTGLFGSFFTVWSLLAPIASGVYLSGVVASREPSVEIRSVVQGAIDQVLVRDGDEVRQGQSLIILDQRRILAEHKSVKLRLVTLTLQRARLQAEFDGFTTYSPGEISVTWIGANSEDVIDIRNIQYRLFHTARDGLRTQIGTGNQESESAREEGRGLSLVLQANRDKARAINADLATARRLQQQREGTLTKVRSLEGAAAETEADLASASVRRQKAEDASIAAKLRSAEVQAKFREVVAAELDATGKEYIDLIARHAALSAELDDLTIRSPVSGHVVGLTNQSAGSLVGAGEQLMTISPGATPRSIEARLPAAEVGSVSNGASVRFLLLGVDGKQYWSAGTVKYLSADRMADKRSGEAYFAIRIEILDEQLAVLGRIRVGMAVQVIIENGSRSIVAFLIGPIMRRLDASLI